MVDGSFVLCVIRRVWTFSLSSLPPRIVEVVIDARPVAPRASDRTCRSYVMLAYVEVVVDFQREPHPFAICFACSPAFFGRSKMMNDEEDDGRRKKNSQLKVLIRPTSIYIGRSADRQTSLSKTVLSAAGTPLSLCTSNYTIRFFTGRGDII